MVETNAGGATIWSSPRDMLTDAGIRDGQREREVQGLLRALFDKLRSQCVCKDGSCAIRSGTPSMSGDPAPACQTQRCQICRVFEAQPRELYRRSLPLRNERLNQLLCCCPAIAQLCRLAKTQCHVIASGKRPPRPGRSRAPLRPSPMSRQPSQLHEKCGRLGRAGAKAAVRAARGRARGILDPTQDGGQGCQQATQSGRQTGHVADHTKGHQPR